MIERRGWAIAAAVYAALTIINVWPLVGVMSTHLPNDTGDPGLIAWVMWWNAHAVPYTERWWNAPMFYPMPGVLALSETFLGIAPFSSPLQWMGASAVTTYNIIYILSFPSAALAAHALARHLTGRHDAALLAGLAFGFSPYRVSQMPHLHLLVSCWMPLALLGLHRYLSERRARDLLLFGVSWLLNGLTTGYYLVYFAVLFGMWMLWFVRRTRDWILIGGTAAIASLPILPILIGYTHYQNLYGFSRDSGEVQQFSADLSAVLAVSRNAWLPAHWSVSPRPEGELYPGAVIALLALAGAIAAWRLMPRGAARKSQRVVFVIGATVLAAATLSWLSGGWRVDLGGVVLSMTRPHRPITLAIWLIIAAVLLDRRWADLWRRRSPLVFYGIGAVLMILLALGPVGRVFGYRFFESAPYSWLMALPGGHGLRVPARFGMLFMLCVALAGALGWRRLTPRGSSGPLVAGIAFLIALESWVPKMLVARVEPMVDLGGLEPTAAVLELPMANLYTETAAMLRATHHGHPVVNGFSGYQPAHYGPLMVGTDLANPTVLAALQHYGPLGVLIDRSSQQEEYFVKYLSQIPGAQRLYRTPVGLVYRLPAILPSVPTATAQDPLPIVSVTASNNQPLVPRMFDGRLDTQWQTAGPQLPGDHLEMAFGRDVLITRLEMDLASYNMNYPRQLRIESIEPAGARTVVWEGAMDGQAVMAGLKDPRRMPLTVEFPQPVTASRLLLTALIADPTWYWSIAELRAYGR